MTTNRKTFDRAALVFCALSALALLPACQTAGGMDSARAGERNARIDAAMERAAGQVGGETAHNLVSLERAYKRNPEDDGAAIDFARALREQEQYNRASMVLSHLARAEDGSASVKAEYAALQAAMGNYEGAEKYAREAILKDAESYQAFHILGIALDAQGYHAQAEVAFRKGLETWEGDPAPIMNNLALNLASQGFLDEASQILQRAAATSPDRPEIERNLRIVTALQQTQATSGLHRPPKPPQKPAAQTR